MTTLFALIIVGLIFWICVTITLILIIRDDERYIEKLQLRLRSTENALDRERADNYTDFPEAPDPCMPLWRFTPHDPSVTFPVKIKADWMVPL